MLGGDSRKTERAKDRTESGLEECHGPEFTMHLDPISSALTKDNRTKARETTGGKGKTQTQQADVSSGVRLN